MISSDFERGSLPNMPFPCPSEALTDTGGSRNGPCHAVMNVDEDVPGIAMARANINKSVDAGGMVCCVGSRTSVERLVQDPSPGQKMNVVILEQVHRLGQDSVTFQ
jgi:hypothetical protein